MYPKALQPAQSHSQSQRRSLRLPFWKRRAVATAPTAGELQHRYLTPVLHYVAARLGARAQAEAEDITAEVFAAAFASLHRFPAEPNDAGDDDPVRAYLFGIARRKLADAYRRQTRHPEDALSPDVPAPADSAPESQLLAHEAACALHRILDALPTLQSEALRLKYVEELSLAEIGLILRKSPGAVGQLLHRARENARRRGAGYFAPDFDEEEKSHAA